MPSMVPTMRAVASELALMVSWRDHLGHRGRALLHHLARVGHELLASVGGRAGLGDVARHLLEARRGLLEPPPPARWTFGQLHARVGDLGGGHRGLLEPAFSSMIIALMGPLTERATKHDAPTTSTDERQDDTEVAQPVRRGVDLRFVSATALTQPVSRCGRMPTGGLPLKL
jgi:hypothetical protein